MTFVYVVGPGEKEDKAGLCVESRVRRLNVLECCGGGGGGEGFVYLHSG